MYKHNNLWINLKLFLCNCWKNYLSCLLTVVPHSPEQTQTLQVASILQKDSFNQWSCVFYLLDKLIDIYSRQLSANIAAWSKWKILGKEINIKLEITARTHLYSISITLWNSMPSNSNTSKALLYTVQIPGWCALPAFFLFRWSLWEATVDKTLKSVGALPCRSSTSVFQLNSASKDAGIFRKTEGSDLCWQCADSINMTYIIIHNFFYVSSIDSSVLTRIWQLKGTLSLQ